MELSRTQERERKRIAVALHDEVAQTLAAAKMRLDLLQAQGSDEHFRNNIAEARELLGKSIRETRSIMTDLSPPLLFDMGLDAACQSLAEQQASRHGIQVRCDIPRSFQEVSQELRMFLFQAIRELLANAAKHGSARNVLVAVEERNGNLLVRVRDDGNGFDTRTLGFPGESGGFGLFSLRERLAVFDGSMKIDSNPGEGTEVTILMPHGADERRKKKRFPRKRKP
jgi:signal transduction histidine kinase